MSCDANETTNFGFNDHKISNQIYTNKAGKMDLFAIPSTTGKPYQSFKEN